MVSLIKLTLFLFSLINIQSAFANKLIRNINCQTNTHYYNDEVETFETCFKHGTNEWAITNGMYEWCCCDRGYELSENKCIKSVSISSEKVSGNKNKRNCICKEDKKNLGLLALVAAPFIVPFVAPLFAVQGLAGAAAFTNGLATLGGGSLASGGLGMAGGMAVTGAATNYAANKMVENMDECEC